MSDMNLLFIFNHGRQLNIWGIIGEVRVCSNSSIQSAPPKTTTKTHETTIHARVVDPNVELNNMFPEINRERSPLPPDFGNIYNFPLEIRLFFEPSCLNGLSECALFEFLLITFPRI